MLRMSKPTRYTVKVGPTLPPPPLPAPGERVARARSNEEVLRLCRELVHDAAGPGLRNGTLDVSEALHAMRSRSFFGMVERYVGNLNRIELERLLCPVTPSHPHPTSSNKSDKYRRGEHLPAPKLLAHLEMELGVNLTDDVFHKLWAALDVTTPLPRDPATWTLKSSNGRFAPCRAECLGMPRRAQSELAWEAGQLFRLTPSVVGLRTNGNGTASARQAAAALVFRQVLLLGVELQHRGIACTALRFMCRHVLPLGALTFADTPQAIAAMSALLHVLGVQLAVQQRGSESSASARPAKRALVAQEYMRMLEEVLLEPESQLRLRCMEDILDGRHGPAVQALFAPLFQEDLEDTLAKRRRAWEQLAGRVLAVPLKCPLRPEEELLRKAIGADRNVVRWGAHICRRAASWVDGLARSGTDQYRERPAATGRGTPLHQAEYPVA